MNPELVGLGDLVAGSVLIFLGMMALAAVALRGRRGDLLLGSFGLFCVLYGVRAIFLSELIGGLGVSRLAAGWVTSTITYLINIPAWIFFWQVLDGRRRSPLRWIVGLVSLFAVAGIVTDLAVGLPGNLSGTPNNLVVLFGIVLSILFSLRLWRRGRWEVRLLITGLLVFGLFAANDNLVSMGAVPWSWREESIGLFFLVGCLAVIAARRFVVNERQLARIEGELEAARTIQGSLLPRELPRLGGLESAARFLPASQVAGDFYDVWRIDDRRIGLLVADVSGHGVPAALIASMVKVAAASHRALADRPAELLAEVNRTLCGGFSGGFVTAVCLAIDVGVDAAASRITLSSAGHPPPLLYRGADASVEELWVDGTLLGRFLDARFSQREVALEPGDRLVVFTDGLLEAAGPEGEQLGDDRLRSLIAKHGRLGAEALCDALLAELRRWIGGGEEPAPADDVTLVVFALEP